MLGLQLAIQCTNMRYAVSLPPFSAFEVDDDVQLVCKYLNAYHHKDDPIHGINRLYELPPGGSVIIGHDVLT